MKLLIKVKLEEILCDTIRSYNISKIQPKEYNSFQILEDYKNISTTQIYTKTNIDDITFKYNKYFNI